MIIVNPAAPAHAQLQLDDLVNQFSVKCQEKKSKFDGDCDEDADDDVDDDNDDEDDDNDDVADDDDDDMFTTTDDHSWN